jgi:preprotein translocase subunit SecG
MAASEQGADGGNGGSGPAIEQVMPKLFSQIDGSAGFLQKVLAVKWILLLALGILTLGFILLYRQQPPAELAAAADTPARARKPVAESPKEKHERRRR